MEFLNRPNGGVEVEIVYAMTELWFAVTLTFSAETILNMTSLEDLYWAIPHRLLALPWWIASLATLAGLILYRQQNRWCAPLRWFGAFISAAIWFTMLQKGIAASGGLLGSLGFYFFGAVWQPRIMMSAWRRWSVAWHYDA
jgi:hypothetical protein